MEKRKSAVGNRIFFVHHRSLSTAKRAEYVSDRMSCIILIGRLCNIIAVNDHKPSDDKRDDSNDSFMRNLSRFSITFLSIV